MRRLIDRLDVTDDVGEREDITRDAEQLATVNARAAREWRNR
jgi:hypothetical protein